MTVFPKVKGWSQKSHRTVARKAASDCKDPMLVLQHSAAVQLLGKRVDTREYTGWLSEALRLYDFPHVVYDLSRPYDLPSAEYLQLAQESCVSLLLEGLAEQGDRMLGHIVFAHMLNPHTGNTSVGFDEAFQQIPDSTRAGHLHSPESVNLIKDCVHRGLDVASYAKDGFGRVRNEDLIGCVLSGLVDPCWAGGPESDAVNVIVLPDEGVSDRTLMRVRNAWPSSQSSGSTTLVISKNDDSLLRLPWGVNLTDRRRRKLLHVSAPLKEWLTLSSEGGTQ